MSYLIRTIKFSLQDFYRNIWLSIVTISILVLTLVSINVLVAFHAVTATAITAIQNKVDISVDFKPTVTAAEINTVKTYLLGLPEVADIEYISRDEALARFKERHSANQTILDVVSELSDNPLGASLRVKARNLDSYATILSALDKPEITPLVASRDYYNRQTMISKVSGWTDTGEKIAFVFIIFFILISALIVFNTIRVAIYTHREEIGIEKLVGATNWFVSLPFILESVFYALAACLITIVIVYPLLAFVQPYVAGFFGADSFNLTDYFTARFFMIFLTELVVIMLVNIVSSMVATRKYLKV
ncbi:FtsX-like permease family protein [Candidatus Falkowbacteria bacterium]|nr:FtsX-like permease family protein [Candidatus Falkowbacteria bacterium]